jgi:peroxiredoxin
MTALLLVLALARRIKEVGAAAGSQPGELPAAFAALAGSKPGYFRAETVSGALVSLDGLAGDHALIGFFLAGCTPCNRQLPAFTELAKTIPGGPSQVVAVVTGPPDDAAEYAARLAAVAAVVRESPRADEGTITHAFAVSSWPSYYLLDPAGTIKSGAPTLSALTVSAAPAAAGMSR